MAVKEVSVDGKNFMLSYEIINPQANKSIIFLHGWGSNKEIMKTFVDEFKEYKQVYIDMPGFGKSQNPYVLTTKDYAKAVDELLKALKIKKDIVIGHSFGGKVGLLLKPQKLVLLASAGIKEPKSLKTRAKIALFKFLKHFGGGGFRKYFVSDDAKEMSENMYETFKNVVDEDFSPYFASFPNKALVFGADNDTAISQNAVKKQAELLKSKLIMLSGDHYFFLNPQNKKKVAKEIIEFDK
ncbi:MAG: alpha/beta hydrolase [Epsilonproteobacteria bacterium]|nr:alpha/beta hydrolase [Campylobacterota bacterium]